MNLARALTGVERPDQVFGIDLVLVYLSSFLVVSGVSLLAPVLATMIAPLGATSASIGLIISVFTLPSVLLTPVVGSLSDTVGRKPLICYGLLAFGTAGTAAGLYHDFNVVLLLRFVQGVGFACVMPLTIVLIGDQLRATEEVAAQGLRGSANATAEFVFPVLGGALALTGWSYPFFVYALAVPLSFLIWRRLKEPVAEERAPLATPYLGQLVRWVRTARNAVVLLMGMSRFLIKYAVYIYLPVYVVESLGYSILAGGTFVALVGIVNAVVSSQAGRIARRFDMITVMCAGFLLLAIGAIVIPNSPGPAVLLPAIGLIGLGDGLIGPMQRSLLTQNSSTHLRGGVIGANHVFVSLGKTLAPGLGLILLVAGLPEIFFLMSFVALVSATLLWLVDKRRQGYRTDEGTDQT